MLRSCSLVALLTVLGAVPSLAAAAASYLGAPGSANASAGAGLSATCVACHGPKGNSVSAAFPNLAGQNYNYLLKQLENFRSASRQAAPMSALIKVVPSAPGDQNLKNLAAYFAAQKLDRSKGANATVPKPAQKLAAAGYRIYAGGDGAEKVPACAACHMPSGLGNAPMAIPRLAGQPAPYVVSQLQRFASGKRHNSPQHVMRVIAKRLSNKQIKAVSAYVQELRPSLAPGVRMRSYAAYVKSVASQPVPGIPASGLSAHKPATSGGHHGA